MKDFSGKVAAITGAASGMGRSLSIELAKRGCHLAISDVDEAGLAETVERAAKHGVTVTSQRLDVADREAVHAWADQVVADHGRVNLIFNNAGVALGASVEGMSYEDFDWLIGINFHGVVNGTKAFLPHLKASGEGHVINISSVFGLLGIPSQSAYNAAKFAVRGFTESLRIELDMEDAGVSCTTVHPGGIKTNIARNARIDHSLGDVDIDPEEAVKGMEKLFITSADKAAKGILRAVELDKRRAMIGPDAHVLNLLAKLPPNAYQRLIAFGVKRQSGPIV
ncbi:SDR family NAD(P)-dependent oxidoreductase [Aquihabitans sp. G128]|uniref:SDR family NAD(P)-dependent oxidoreductase n=1 Tax=Aquihabitans sp. G128 TaxID=2849779 RepID=UPI001C23889F|nr:SDR family NAD(P)-dependent oxidoreductase [Aquihabitans sp. G128]QXC59226.1 SDR family NAD(P)-dependent oxidoreductase [Aquihabitans sp. G128]